MAQSAVRHAKLWFAGQSQNWALAFKLPKIIVDVIKTLKDVDESNVRFSSAVDGKEYLDRFHNDVLQETIDAYKGIVVKTQEEQVVKDFILALLQGDKSSLYSKLRDVEDIVDEVKRQGELRSTPLKIAESYHKAKADGSNPELVSAVESLLSKEKTENNGATATAANQPVSTTEGTTQQQGGQEAVQQGTTDAGQGGAATATTVQPNTADAVKKATDKKIQDFNNKVDANAKALIDFLTPKGMEGVKKSGLGVAEIVNNASKIIKAAYAASQNIKDAVQKGLDYFIANWDENELGELPVEALRQKLEDDLADGGTKIDDLANSIPALGEVKNFLSGKTIVKYTGEEPKNSQNYTATVLEEAFAYGQDIIEKGKELFGKDYVQGLLDYVENSNISVSAKALIYVSLRNDLYSRRMQSDETDYESIIKLQTLVYEKSQAFAHDNAVAMNMWKLQNTQKYGFNVDDTTKELLTEQELEDRAKLESAVQASEDAVNKEFDADNKETVDSQTAEDVEVEKAKDKSKPKERKKTGKNKWKAAASKKGLINDMVDKLKDKINKLNC
jgi:hypothetical protein